MILVVLSIAIQAIIVLIIVRAVLSWFPDFTVRYRSLVRLLDEVTEPFVGPFRRLVSPRSMSGLDISPALAIIALSILQRLLEIIF